MKQRCFNPNNTYYLNYGGRGIIVCDHWKNSFENFYADMGVCPSGHTLDRIDVNGNYEPGNCKWATQTEQARNRTNNHLITFNEKTQTISAWAKELGFADETLRSRITKYNWPIEKALTTPLCFVSKKRKF